MLKERGNPICSKYGWGGLAVLIFGSFSFGYGFSRRNFTAHRKGLIIAGGVAFGIICVGIITCVVVSWRRKKEATQDEQNLVVRPPAYEPPKAADQNNSPREGATDSQQRAEQYSIAQQDTVNGLPQKPPPAYSERLGDRVCDPNSSSMLDV